MRNTASSWKWIFAVIFIALLLRLLYIPYAKYENETARDIIVAKQMIDTRTLRLVGITGEISEDSQQQSFGPLYYYFIAAFLIFYRHPYAAVLMVALMSILSVALCYIFTRKFFDEKLAFISTSLFAFSPWFLAFVSLNLMTPSLLAPFVIPLFISLYKIIIQREDKYLILTAVSSAIMLHIHLSAAAIILTAIVLLVFLRPSIFLSKWMAWSIASAAVLFVPFFIYNLQHGSLTDVFSFLTHRYESSRFENLRDSVGIPLMFATTYFGPYLLGSEHVFQSLPLRLAFLFFDLVLALCVIAGFLLAARYSIEKNRSPLERKKYIILVAWFALPVLFSVLSGNNISPHYLLIIYPVQFIFMALFIKQITRSSITLQKIAVASIILGYLLFVISFFAFISRDGGTDGIYGIPLEAKISVLQYLRDHDIKQAYFYKNVKKEYKLLGELIYPEISLQPLAKIDNTTQGYLILDLYSRANFMEKQLSLEELAFLAKMNTTHVGRVSIVGLGRS